MIQNKFYKNYYIFNDQGSLYNIIIINNYFIWLKRYDFKIMRKWFINKKNMKLKTIDFIKHELRINWKYILNKYFYIIFDDEEYIIKNLTIKNLLNLQ